MRFQEAFASRCDGSKVVDGKLPQKHARYGAFQKLKHLLSIYTELLPFASTHLGEHLLAQPLRRVAYDAERHLGSTLVELLELF